MHIALIAKPGHANTGVGRYTIELERNLRAQGHDVIVVHPVIPLPKWMVRITRRLGWDLSAFFNTYPVWVRYPQADLYHFTSQNLATLMLVRRPPGKSVITVHDIIPWVVRNDPEQRVYHHFLDEIFDQLALKGIQRAEVIVTDSTFTSQTLFDEIEISKQKMETVYLGIN